MKSNSAKVLAANLVFPDFQDIQNHLSVETLKTIGILFQDFSKKGWEFALYNINQFSNSAEETCTNLLNFFHTIIAEIKSAELFKEPIKAPLAASDDPNDDSQDYTPELNEWIESQDTKNENKATNKDSNTKVLGDRALNQENDHLDTTKNNVQVHQESIEVNKVVNNDQTKTKVEPSFIDGSEHASIKVTATLNPTEMDNRLVDEPMISKTTVAQTVG